MTREFTYNSSSPVSAAFDARGREIPLPRNGRIQLPAGGRIKRGHTVCRLECDCILVKRTRRFEEEVYYDDYLEEMPGQQIFKETELRAAAEYLASK